MPREYRIGELAAACQLTHRAIRFYEEKGLVTPRRAPGGLRLFSAADKARLECIKRLAALGYPLERIRINLDLCDGVPASAADRRARVEKLDACVTELELKRSAIDAEIVELRRVRRQLVARR